ncbi:serine protease snake-like [Spodoptera litura]|uniref:Serine protease snake-like n=1 Tax=Spodoptera litura TaxID=69820 RepID=A0A9J7DNZ1_SPOLT|nr:serine protease snake-like [Spodoptera litura]
MFVRIFILFLCGVIVTDSSLNLDEESKCMWNGIPGECVRMYRCFSSFIDLKNKDYAPICNFKGKEPIICCTDCSLVNDTRKMIVSPSFGIIHKTGQMAQDKCMEFIHKLNYPCKLFRRVELSRVYIPDTNCNKVIEEEKTNITSGGSDSLRDEFPHMALLGYSPNVKSAEWLCGGSVISERFILTAGHCLGSPTLGQVKYIALGILKRTDPPEFWQIYNVKRIVVHPGYKSPSKYHDIALLETDTEIAFNDHVLPACLHTRGEVEDILFATGWGALGHKKDLADTLQNVQLLRFDEKECSKHYPPHRHLKFGYNNTTQMCYGDRIEPKDTCSGDSGGPLQTKNYDTFYCASTIFGVTSYGRQCGISAGSGMYSRVQYYVPWIESIVWP